MRVVLPIAIVAILIAAALFGGSKSYPQFPVVDQAAPAHVAEPYPVAFDPFTGWGVADLQAARPPVAHSQESPPAFADVFEVDPLDRYGVAPPPVHRVVRTVTDPWLSFADVRARYEDAAPASDPWWGDTPLPLDAK